MLLLFLSRSLLEGNSHPCFSRLVLEKHAASTTSRTWHRLGFHSYMVILWTKEVFPVFMALSFFSCWKSNWWCEGFVAACQSWILIAQSMLHVLASWYIQGFMDQVHMHKVLCRAHGNKPMVALTLQSFGSYQSNKLFPEPLPGFFLEGGIFFLFKRKFK